MYSVTRKILLRPPPLLSSITRPSNRTRFSCCNDLQWPAGSALHWHTILTHVITLASVRNFCVAIEVSLINSFTATFCPL